MRKGISGKRLQRIEEEVAPLFARGFTQREIANQLGISKSVIAKDCALIQTTWEEQISDRLENARAELVFKHDHLYRQCMAAYHSGPPQPKWIELASKELECLGRLLGQAGPAINLHAHQHNVAVTTDAVAALFQPLDPGAYAEMVAAKPLPPADEAAELEPIDVELETAGRDEWSGGAGADTTIAGAGGDTDEPTERKPKFVKHPLRG